MLQRLALRFDTAARSRIPKRTVVPQPRTAYRLGRPEPTAGPTRWRRSLPHLLRPKLHRLPRPRLLLRPPRHRPPRPRHPATRRGHLNRQQSLPHPLVQRFHLSIRLRRSRRGELPRLRQWLPHRRPCPPCPTRHLSREALRYRQPTRPRSFLHHPRPGERTAWSPGPSLSRGRSLQGPWSHWSCRTRETGQAAPPQQVTRWMRSSWFLNKGQNALGLIWPCRDTTDETLILQ